MTNPPVLLEHVSMVRHLLSESDDPNIAIVGRLGEITYLVDEHITQGDLEILDILIQSVSSQDRPAFAGRGLQAKRRALAPYVGKNLLKAGLRYASRPHEIYVDPTAASIVYSVGFFRPEAIPEPLANAAPEVQARWIFDHPSDGYYGEGRRVVELLLDGRDASELSGEELRLLAKGYNWWGQNGRAFEIAKLGLARLPHSTEWLSTARLYAQNEFLLDLPRLLSSCDACIRDEIGPPEFWHLVKADKYIEIATGECELEEYKWTPGDRMMHPEFLRLAADALAAALASTPELREEESAHDWVGDWNSRFAAVLQEPEYGHLAQ